MRRRDREAQCDGFTLVELCVVIAIIGLLLAIAVPTFLASQNKAKDRSAQSSLRNSLNAALTVYADSQDYGQLTVASLTLVEPSRIWLTASTVSANPNQVSFDHPNSTSFVAAAHSMAGGCFFIRDDRALSVGFDRFAYLETGLCEADLAPTGATDWTSQW